MSIHSGSKYGLPDGVEVIAELSGNTELTLEDCLHQLDAYENAPRVIETLETQHGRHSEFNSPMVLFHYIIQVFATADLYGIRPSEVELVPHTHAT